jgi:hypothetical protein
LYLFSAEVKKCGTNYNSTPPYVFMAWCLRKHRDNFTFVYSVTTVMTLWAVRPRNLDLTFIKGGDFSVFHRFQPDFGAHPASFPVATGGSLPRSNAVSTFFFYFWFVRLLALRPLLAYCASLGW